TPTRTRSPGRLRSTEVGLGTGPGEAGARGRDGAAGNWRPGKGREASRREGRLGHGPGRLWPWPRRPGVRGVAEGSREAHAGATGSGRESHGSVTEPRLRHRDRGKSTVLRVLSNSHDRAACIWAPIGDLIHAARLRGPTAGPKTDTRRAEG